MFQFTVIGNLGGDAEFHNENGQQYVTFRVGHTDRHTDGNGNQVEETVWVSCILNGDGGRLLQYLVKGQKVCVVGDGSLRTYHSEKMRRLVAGANCFVRSVELVGARPDAIPSALFSQDGVQFNVTKYYNAVGSKSTVLYDKAGQAFNVDANGWVLPAQQQGQTQAQQAQATDAPFTGQGYETVEQAQEQAETKSKKAKK